MPNMMCKNQNCPSRLTCYRFTAQPAENQRYYAYEIRGKYSVSCENYWAARPAEAGDYSPVGPYIRNPYGSGRIAEVRRARKNSGIE